jgi:hypothetical protein
MSDQLVETKILSALENAALLAPSADAGKMETARRLIRRELESDLGLTELKAAVAELTQHLETEPADTRADLRAAAARTLRVLAALR